MGVSGRFYPLCKAVSLPAGYTRSRARMGSKRCRCCPLVRIWGARLLTVVTDKGYRGRFARHVAKRGLVHQIGSRPPSTRGFVPVAKRWVVEPTFAWLTGFRRLVINYEFTPRSPETWLLIANMTMCIDRFAPR